MFSTEEIYEVVTYSVGDTKAGTKMGKLQLKGLDDEEFLNCILWEETLNRMDSKLFRCGNHLRIVSGSFNEKYNNCLVSALELIKEAKMGLDEKEREEKFKLLMGWIDKIKDDKLKDFVKNIYLENAEVIKVAPAAKMMHHNFIGGLMVHVLECMNLAETVSEAVFQKIAKDELYAACLLHDIGKIYEYKIDLETGLIEYNEDFRKNWLSHSQYGYSLCMNNNYVKIAKMIAAHHGRKDWGAIIDLDEKDLESYLYIVHHIDDLSAKFGQISVSMLG